MLTAWTRRVSTAVAVCTVASVVSALAGLHVHALSMNIAPLTLLALSIATHNTPAMLFIMLVQRFEMAGVGAQWSNWQQFPLLNSAVSVRSCLQLLAFDFALYLVVGGVLRVWQTEDGDICFGGEVEKSREGMTDAGMRRTFFLVGGRNPEKRTR